MPDFLILALGLCAALLAFVVAVALWPITLVLVIWHYLGLFWAVVVGIAIAAAASS